MELQANDTSKKSQAISEASSTSPTRPRPNPSTSAPPLRFPRPQGSLHLAHWISTSSPDIMQPSSFSDAGSLTDSTYELINSTDGEAESQDGRMAESLGSLSASQPEDVHSLDGSDDAYESSDDEETDDHSSSDISIRYADTSLRNPSSQPPINSFQFSLPSETATPLVQSIEFKEAEVPGENPIIEKVSVKHTIREFNEEESAEVADDLGMGVTPKRMVATIRQTMSQGCLSTKEPLRVLYVGSPAGQKDIIYKLSSAIWASGTSDTDKVAYRNTEGVYNIVPISSFGSTKEPEIQLMETSGYQIKVEHCTSAEEVVYEGQFFPSDTVYCLTIDEDRVYRSLYNPSGSAIQPRWVLPHIAIFYMSENDDEHAEKTRLASWKFMKRHGIPSIFISHSPVFTKASTGNWAEYIDQHALHMCLESRDPDTPSAPQRLPIDLASFTNIDARQMNRNLSYLTGLVQLAENQDGHVNVLETRLEPKTKNKSKSKSKSKDVKEHQGESVREKLTASDFWKKLPPVAELGSDEVTCIRISLAVLVAVLSLVFSQTMWTWVRPDGISTYTSVQPTSVSTAPAALVSSVRSVTPTKQVSTTTSTVVINVTSTKTIKISKVEPTASSLASVLSFAGFLSDKPSSLPVESEPKRGKCTVEVYGPSEILVRLPGQTASSFLAKGAIRITVYRGEESVKWQRLSTNEDGLLVDIGKENAYGLLNVSVVTTRRPKINETFEVNFGKPVVAEVLAAGMNLLQDIVHKMAATADEAAQLVEGTCRPAAFAGMERLREDATVVLKSILNAGKTASSYSSKVAGDTVNQVKNSLNPKEVSRLVKGAQDHLEQHLKTAENVRDEVGLSLLKAQIASKLWWLKAQGKHAEYNEYERKAAQFLKSKHAEVKELQKLRLTENCGLPGTSKHRKCQKKLEARAKSKDCSRWKKMIIG